MHKRIVALCSFSAMLSLGAVTGSALAANGPVSSMSESTAPAASGAPAPSAPASAQTPAGPGTPAPGATTDVPGVDTGQFQSDNISDEQLRKFVASAQQVAVLSQQYSQQLQGTADQTQQQQVVAEANDKMADAIQANGLTVQEFNGISEAVDRDPALNERARQMLQ